MKKILTALMLLMLLPFAKAYGEETRGKLVGARDRITVEDASGQQHSFRFDDGMIGRRGISAKNIHISQIAIGSPVIVEHANRVAREVRVAWSWYEYPALWIEERVENFNEAFGETSFFNFKPNVMALLGISLVGLICGVVSSLVVSNRMAFFSDALAHCAFAGVGLGFLLFLAGALGEEGILLVMILFGAAVGVGIAYVREQTNLASDTVIGVFFAGAMGFGAILLKAIGKQTKYNPENFLFGDPFGVTGHDVVYLVLLLLLLVGVLSWRYNQLVFISFNPSLARSRNFNVRLSNYLFIVLLGFVVNICLKLVGALLINALLIVPAAAASSLSRNLRQFFWISILLSILAGLGGLFVSTWFPEQPTGGTIVVLIVMMFFVSMLVGRWVRGARPMVKHGF